MSAASATYSIPINEQLTSFVWSESISVFILDCSSSYFCLSGLPPEILTTLSDVSVESNGVAPLVGTFFLFVLVSFLVVGLEVAGMVVVKLQIAKVRVYV